MRNYFLFTIWPYAAVALLAAGLAFRSLFLTGERSWLERHPDQNRSVLAQGKFWRFSMLLLLLGHLVGLILPRFILAWNRVPLRLYFLEAAACVVALVAVVGWLRVMRRHLAASGFSATDVGDAAFLGVVFVSIASGLLMAAVYRWGSSWGAATFPPYAMSLLRGRPTAETVGALPFLAQLHLFAGISTVAVLPFTSLARMFIVALHRGGDVATRPIFTRLQSVRTSVRLWLEKHDPTPRIWPEEED